MFDEILQLVKDHLGGNSEINAAIPAGQTDAVHNEIASHIANGLSAQTDGSGGLSGLVGKLESGVASGGALSSAVEGGLVSSLAGKFGLPASVTGAIAGALPGLLQKLAGKA